MEQQVDVCVKRFFDQGLSEEQLKVELARIGIEETRMDEWLRNWRSLKYERIRSRGFKCLALGALLCVSGCLFTFFYNDYSPLYAGFTLYGMTIIGTILILAGLAMVLGL